jgi:hypothetical protein
VIYHIDCKVWAVGLYFANLDYPCLALPCFNHNPLTPIFHLFFPEIPCPE